MLAAIGNGIEIVRVWPGMLKTEKEAFFPPGPSTARTSLVQLVRRKQQQQNTALKMLLFKQKKK